MASLRLDVEEWRSLLEMATQQIEFGFGRPCLKTAAADIRDMLGCVDSVRDQLGDERAHEDNHSCEQAGCREKLDRYRSQGLWSDTGEAEPDDLDRYPEGAKLLIILDGEKVTFRWPLGRMHAASGNVVAERCGKRVAAAFDRMSDETRAP